MIKIKERVEGGMRMLDWEKVKNDKALLKRVEELVESVCDTFHDFPQDICDE